MCQCPPTCFKCNQLVDKNDPSVCMMDQWICAKCYFHVNIGPKCQYQIPVHDDPTNTSISSKSQETTPEVKQQACGRLLFSRLPFACTMCMKKICHSRHDVEVYLLDQQLEKQKNNMSNQNETPTLTKSSDHPIASAATEVKVDVEFQQSIKKEGNNGWNVGKCVFSCTLYLPTFITHLHFACPHDPSK